MLRVLGLAAVIVLAASVGMGLLDEQQQQLEQAAINQASAACESQLPGDGWTVANWTVNTSQLDGAQNVLCTRNGTAQRVSVDIEVNLSP